MLKGIARPTDAYRILGVSEAASRFEAAMPEAKSMAPSAALALLRRLYSRFTEGFDTKNPREARVLFEQPRA